MATQSSSPPNPTEEKPQTPEVVQPMNEAQQDVRAEAPKPIAPKSVFVNSEPMREEQVQNAVKFLSHPKVSGSPVMYRRSFLEKKGLTKEEIDEAFRRVPDPPSSGQGATISRDGQLNQPSNTQPQAQTLQPVAAATVGVPSTVGTLRKSPFHWYHAVIAIGVLAASGAGTAVLIKKAIIPRLKSWIRKVVSEEEDDPVKKAAAKPSVAEEAAAAAKAAAAAAADVAKASQEMLKSQSEEKIYLKEFMNLLDMQVKEMKTMSNAIHNLEEKTNNPERTYLADQDHMLSVSSSKQPYINGKMDYESRTARSSSPPAPVEPSVAPHPKSYMEIMAMIQRGEKPSNIRDINDLPPNPNQPPSNPRLAPRTKPWEVSQTQNGSSQVIQSQGSGEGFSLKAQDNGVNGVNYQLNGENSTPWYKSSSRITEIENEDEVKTNQRSQPVQRTWVPPQPPPVVMPQAAEAIRRPKPSITKEQGVEDQSASNSSDVTDELQRITKVAESGGEVEISYDDSGPQTTHSVEIQEEQVYS